MMVRLPIRMAVAAALLLAASARAEQRREITDEGTEAFRALLVQRGLKPLEDPREILDDPKHTLLIAFRGASKFGVYTDQIANLPFDAKTDYVDRGGAFFFASDQAMGVGSSKWHNDFGFSISGNIVSSADVDTCYQGNRQCPYVEGLPAAVPDLFQSRSAPNIAGMEPREGKRLIHVATNRPSYLMKSSNLRMLAAFTQDCTEVHTRSGYREPSLREENRRFAQSWRYDGGGKFLVFADHSIFINSMLAPRHVPDDNFAFANNCLDWLMAGPDGPRTQVLFMQDGVIWKKDDYNLKLLAQLPVDLKDLLPFLLNNPGLLWSMREQLEDHLAALDHSHAFADLERGGDGGTPLGTQINESIANGVGRNRLVRIIILVGMAALLGYGLLSMIKSRFSYPRATPRLSLALDRVKPCAGLLEMRLRGGVGRGHYYEVARDRAREMFGSLDLTPGEGARRLDSWSMPRGGGAA